MSRKLSIGLSLALLLGAGLSTGCNDHKTAPPNVIAATSGSGQSAVLTTAFTSPLIATVTAGGKPVQGVPVQFSAPTTGATALFSNGMSSVTVTTGSDGTASAKFTANNVAGSYVVIAAAPASKTASTSVTYSLQNAGSIYSFNLNGLETTNPSTGVANYYALSGSVILDGKGNVVGGEEDYNDGNGLTAVQTGITGGTLAVNSSGTGTLTLQTSNASVGVGGTETLAVQFVNTNHGLIAQFDGSATSSGTIDAQSMTAPSGGYAFTLSGVDPEGYNAYDVGGVLAVTGTSWTGTIDLNDAGNVSYGNPATGTLTAPDIYGRGEFDGFSVSGTPITIAYYVVGPEALRLIEVDNSGSALGSAFGQGTSTLSDAALGTSVFAVFGNPYASTPYVMVGQLNTSQSASPSSFSAVADVTEGQNVYGGIYYPRPLGGPYAVSDGANGYGDLTVTSWATTVNGSACAPWCYPDPPIANMGLYTVDPRLNIIDPDNTKSGLGGALLANMDENWAGGTGIAVPQTDTNTSDFTGSYNFGWQDIANGQYLAAGEFDFVGAGSVVPGTDTNTATPTPEFVVSSSNAELNDLFGAFNGGTSATYPSAIISAPLESDASNVGRYTLDYNQQSTEMSITPAMGLNPQYFGIVAYQASGSLLFWSDQDWDSISFGLMEAPGSLTGLPSSNASIQQTRSNGRMRKQQ